MPVVSMLVPSRGKLPVLASMLESLQRCTVEPLTVELVARLDDDDPDLTERTRQLERFGRRIPTQILIGPRAPMGIMTVQMSRAARGAFVWLLNDDIVHETLCWDRLVCEATAERPTDVLFPDDGLFGVELACFPLIPKAHIDATDFFGVGRYERYLIDSVISDLYSFTLNRLVFLPQWKIRHLNAHPVSEVQPERWSRLIKGDQTRAYQPADPEALERDQARYVEHVKSVQDMAAVIRSLDAVHA